MAEKEIRRYEVPGFGEIALIHNPDGGINGKYYARSYEFGIFARFNEDEEILMQNAGLEIKKVLESRKKTLENEVKPISDSLAKIVVSSQRGRLLDGFEVKRERK